MQRQIQEVRKKFAGAEEEVAAAKLEVEAVQRQRADVATELLAVKERESVAGMCVCVCAVMRIGCRVLFCKCTHLVHV